MINLGRFTCTIIHGLYMDRMGKSRVYNSLTPESLFGHFGGGVPDPIHHHLGELFAQNILTENILIPNL